MADNKIFVSYRRQDASGEAGRLVDHLQEAFGDDSVFLDVETIEAGLDFVQAIEKALSSCSVLVAMIGPHWATIKDSKGNLRLFNEDDFIRIEISAALKRDIRVIPVLVNGAIMPSPEELPEDLRSLTRRHAQELSSSRWKYDSEQLTSVLSKFIEPKPQSTPISKPVPNQFIPKQPEAKSWWAKNYLWVIGGVVGFLVLMGMCVPDEPTYEPTIETENTTQTDLSTENPDGNEVYNSLLLEGSIPDVSGDWLFTMEGEENVTFVFLQDGSSVKYEEYDVNNEKVGEGFGQINGSNMVLEYFSSVYQLKGTINMNTINSGQSWEGTIYLPSNNTSYATSLSRSDP